MGIATQQLPEHNFRRYPRLYDQIYLQALHSNLWVIAGTGEHSVAFRIGCWITKKKLLVNDRSQFLSTSRQNTS